jgi:hypothetical protein
MNGHEAYKPDSMDWTPEAALQKALKAVQGGELTDCDECVIVFRFGGPGDYHTKLFCAGMRNSEIVALLEVMKSRLLAILNTPDQ